MEEARERGVKAQEDQYTHDGTVDLRGRPFLRSKGGRWTACSFIVGYEVFERMAYYGIASNLVIYLTEKLRQGTVSASNNVTNWVGTVWMTPTLGAYIADAHLGRYWTFIISSAIYLMGMILLTFGVSLPALRPPPCHKQNEGSGLCDNQASLLQLGVFYTALYIIALGTGGTKPNISTMGADQFDDFEPKERKQKLSFFNWWMFSIFFGTLFANTVLVYVQDTVGWAVGYALPTAGLAISIIVFLVGTPYYRHKLPSGSPFMRIVRVLVAAVRKWKVVLPAYNSVEQFYELSPKYYTKNKKFRIEHSPSLRFLDRAAVIIKDGPSPTPWTLCTVTQVEESKQMIKMLPILVTTFMSSVMSAQVNTLFIKQGVTLDRRMGPHFNIPPASLAAIVTLFMLASLVLYDRLLVPLVRRHTKDPRGITLLQRMGIGLAIHVLIMVVASLTERYRLHVVQEHGLQDKKSAVPLSIFVLLPQFALMGIADTFVDVAKLEFFYDQAPEGMKSLGTSYFTTSLGIGNFLSSFLLKTTAEVSKRDGGKGWIQNNLNGSHLDYYYAFLAMLNALNLLVFLVVSKFYVYNTDVVEMEIELRRKGSARLEEEEEEMSRISEKEKELHEGNKEPTL